jgi:signal transduction histidine kinase
MLSTVKLFLEWIQDPKTKSDKSALLSDATITLEDSISTLKEISNKLSPSVLANYGLNIAVQSFLKKIGNHANINFAVNIQLQTRIQPQIEKMLYRVLVEAINNTIKYANASNITISVSPEVDKLIALFKDDGIGFNFKEILALNKGNGLLNMQNRVTTYEGTFSIKSEPGQGTEILITIPNQRYLLT